MVDVGQKQVVPVWRRNDTFEPLDWANEIKRELKDAVIKCAESMQNKVALRSKNELIQRGIARREEVK